MPRFGLALAKKAVHAAEDAMGQRGAMDSAFALHQVSHLQNEVTEGSRTAGQGVAEIRDALKRK
jgi:enoyl-CoA hydratase